MKRVALVFSVALSLSVATIGLRGQSIPQPPHVAEIVPATVSVSDVSGKAIYLTEGDLCRLPPQTVIAIDYGMPTTFEGVLLKDVIAKPDLPFADKSHSTAASYSLVAEGKDGYRAVFSWAELSSTDMGEALYLVTKRDGRPLSAIDGPFLLVVPGRNDRWVRQLTALEIQQMK
jgi:hypothetical protein